MILFHLAKLHSLTLLSQINKLLSPTNIFNESRVLPSWFTSCSVPETYTCIIIMWLSLAKVARSGPPACGVLYFHRTSNQVQTGIFIDVFPPVYLVCPCGTVALSPFGFPSVYGFHYLLHLVIWPNYFSCPIFICFITPFDFVFLSLSKNWPYFSIYRWNHTKSHDSRS